MTPPSQSSSGSSSGSSSATTKPISVAIIPGDGIGPEISESVQRVFEAAKVPVAWTPLEAGLGEIEKRGAGITAETLAALASVKVAIKGPTTTPVGGGHKSINVTIRKALDLYVNVRPIKTLPGVDTPFKDVDLVIVRENIEDTYGGIEHMQSPDVAQCLRLITRSGSLRAHRYAFELARREKRRSVTCVHKANIMKITDGLWLDAFREVAKGFPEIEANDMIVDNACMQLVRRPQQFDVLVAPNLFGDIISDLCAGLVGGLGVAAGANIGERCAIFEAVHGSAPDIAGQNKANPTAILMSAVSMLRHLSLLDHAARIERAVLSTLSDPAKRTGDLGGKAGTREFTENIVSALR